MLRGTTYTCQLNRGVAPRFKGRILNAQRIFLLDENIFDKILDNGEIRDQLIELVGSGKIQLFGTWIDEQELQAMAPSKPDKWKQIQILMSELNVKRQAVAGIIIGHARLGEAKFIPSDENHRLADAIRDASQDVNDLSLAMTAKIEGTTLVTEDQEMQAKAKSIIQVETLNWNEFTKAIRQFCHISVEVQP